MMKDNYQLMAGGARSITTIAINIEIEYVFMQIKSAAENGDYSVIIAYDPESDFTSKYYKYKRRLSEMGYSTELDKDREIMTINW